MIRLNRLSFLGLRPAEFVPITLKVKFVGFYLLCFRQYPRRVFNFVLNCGTAGEAMFLWLADGYTSLKSIGLAKGSLEKSLSWQCLKTPSEQAYSKWFEFEDVIRSIQASHSLSHMDILEPVYG